jgi:hypothetical protein
MGISGTTSQAQNAAERVKPANAAARQKQDEPKPQQARLSVSDEAPAPVASAEPKQPESEGAIEEPSSEACLECESSAWGAGWARLPFQDGVYGLGPDDDGLFVDGWQAQGFTSNLDSPRNKFNLPVTFNDRANQYQMNQAYVAVGRKLNSNRCNWQLGGRVDLLYGSDYFFTTALGLETHQDGSPKWNSGQGPRGGGAALYGLALPQAYAEVSVPVGNGLGVKLGHFYSIIGVESVMAPENFFYSHAYTHQYGEPFTHTGLLADYNLSSQWNVQAGFTRGWDTWEDNNDALGFLGGVKWTCLDGCTTVTFALHTGAEDAAGQNNRTMYSLVVKRDITCRLSYIFQHDFGMEANAEIAGGLPDSAKWYGINQYFLYQLTDRTDVGLRAEWFRDQDNARVLGIPIDTLVRGGNYIALTAGMNWKPASWVRVRPELRWDHSNVSAPGLGIQGMFDDRTQKDQLTAAVDVLLIY